jgi:hypothetical protein
MNKNLFHLTNLLLWTLSMEVRPQSEVMHSYFGISGGYTLITGSFNGSDFFQTDEHIVLVPTIKPSFGLGGVIGIGSNKFALDIGYYITRSDYTSMDEGFSGKCTTHMIRVLGLTKYFNKYAEGNVRPYIDFDFSGSWSRFDKIAYPVYNIEDPLSARYSGIIIGLGAGTLIKMSDKLAMDIRVLPEFCIGTDIRVKGYKWYEIAKFGNFLLQSTIVLKYYFKGI